MNMEFESIKKHIKENIEYLINEKKYVDAKALIEEYMNNVTSDPEIYSMKAIIEIQEGKYDIAQDTLIDGLRHFSDNFDLNYNLGYVYELKKKYSQAYNYYTEALNNCNDDEMRSNVDNILETLKQSHPKISAKQRKKIVFFDKGDDKFIWNIINELSKENDIKHITVKDYKQIDEGMQWADICWFEWCDELIVYASKLQLAEQKKILCRIHGYEVYTNFIRNVNWKNINNLIIVAPHIRRIFEENTKDINLGNLKIDTVFCGINVEEYPVNIKRKGFNLGYLGYINYKKNLPLTFDIFKKLHDIDNRYKLYLAGEFQDSRTLSYLNYFIKEHNLSRCVFFDGWQDNKHKILWFNKIDYMIISSIDEGLCFAAAEAMCSGIKPILHNCEGIKDHYDKKYIFSTIDEAVEMVKSAIYNSNEYRFFIEKNYNITNELSAINEILNSFV